MSTYLHDFSNNLMDNWQEVDLLIEEAKKYEESNSDVYNVLCRSVTILTVAHLEGFTKEIVKVIVKDLNTHCKFRELPRKIQKYYCSDYLLKPDKTNSKKHNEHVDRLVLEFCKLDAEINYEPFVSQKNNNPKPTVIDIVCNSIGIKNVFSYLHDSDFDTAFSLNSSSIVEMIEDSKEHLDDKLMEFPFQCSLERMKLETCPVDGNQRTLWEEFLDDINMKRHKVVHGNIFTNSENITSLELAKNKVMLLQYALIELVGSVIKESVQIEK